MDLIGTEYILSTGVYVGTRGLNSWSSGTTFDFGLSGLYNWFRRKYEDGHTATVHLNADRDVVLEFHRGNSDFVFMRMVICCNVTDRPELMRQLTMWGARELDPTDSLSTIQLLGTLYHHDTGVDEERWTDAFDVMTLGGWVADEIQNRPSMVVYCRTDGDVVIDSFGGVGPKLRLVIVCNPGDRDELLAYIESWGVRRVSPVNA